MENIFKIVVGSVTDPQHKKIEVDILSTTYSEADKLVTQHVGQEYKITGYEFAYDMDVDNITIPENIALIHIYSAWELMQKIADEEIPVSALFEYGHNMNNNILDILHVNPLVFYAHYIGTWKTWDDFVASQLELLFEDISPASSFKKALNREQYIENLHKHYYQTSSGHVFWR